VLAALAAPGFYSPSGAQSKRVRFEQDVEQVFTNHEDVRLDSQTAAQRVRESGRLSVQTPARDLEIILSPNDLRAPQLPREEVIDGESCARFPMAALNTYKGSVVGMPTRTRDSTVDDDIVEGMIITGTSHIFLSRPGNIQPPADAAD